jgi:hypothetical protein
MIQNHVIAKWMPSIHFAGFVISHSIAGSDDGAGSRRIDRFTKTYEIFIFIAPAAKGPAVLEFQKIICEALIPRNRMFVLADGSSSPCNVPFAFDREVEDSFGLV